MPVKVIGIRRKCLRMIMGASRDQHPNEFSAALRAKDGVITEILLMPGTQSGRTSAIPGINNLPIDFSIAGSVHSHPSGYPIPSEADLNFFGHFGNVHIITASPFGDDDWAAYDVRGNRIELKVV
jgi:proteasome lid subunit RPN8/RPN11